MASDRYRSLSPEAILATLRSLPRRYRAELTNDPSIDLDAVARQGSGPSPAGLIATTAGRIASFADAIHKAAVLDQPSITIAEPAGEDPGSIDRALALLDAAVARAAEVVDAQPTEAWARTARVSGSDLAGSGSSAELTVLELAQDGAREGVERLRELTALLDRLKGDR